MVFALVVGCRGGRGVGAAADGAQAGDDQSAAEPGASEGRAETGSAQPDREPLSQYMARFDRDAPAPAPALEPAAAGKCPKQRDRDRDVGIVISPLHPAKGEELRIMAATLDGEEPLALRVELERRGEPIETEQIQRAGVPAATVARFTPSVGGRYEVIVGRDGEGLRCTSFSVREYHFKDESMVDLTRVWSNQRSWNAAEEALYSAWVRELFSGPADQDLAWKALSEVTSDRDRNLLHDHLGREEDHPSRGFSLVPDCADTPYFLRAYWSFKRGLPFGFRKCSRGKKSAPSCFDLRTNLDPPDRREHWIDPPVADAVPIPAEQLPDKAAVPTHNDKIEYFFQRSVGWSVHTGNGRCAFGDSNSDLYPVALDRRGLRPGTVYADPYGHILVLAELVAPRGSAPGILFAVDGQPDGSITRKRFWEGNFLWNQSDPSLGGSGFKAFRPIMNSGSGDVEVFTQMNDETLAALQDYGDVSDMQQALAPAEFYDLMERLITPGERSPFAAQAELVAALAEAARVRVTSVDNGVEYHAAHPDEIIEMPWGHSVFETSGAWENFSTPARDLRLLIAIDVVAGFADKVRRNPSAFGLDPERDPESFELTMSYLAEQREQLLADPDHAISYERSDGSSWKLGLDQVVARAPAFEAAYNPNDCPEVRWGAVEGQDEHATCDRRAPDDQQIKMRYYRVWFAERRRPSRGDEGPEIPELAEQQAAL
ncbi:hypothetical protein ENSA7_12550 [Enhygromyxa salina]|uniref:Uncharacterized protein n=1 Tax=Enhygromyxa salina TaxID=215803 RepID=A0A2S9YV77_9BACT|nr:hypothetical protein ENSA7_12550 [Enhygromyxa salina]